MKPIVQQSVDSVLFITLDSCRYDTFSIAEIPNMKSIAPCHKAQAPSHYTYGSHSAMFVGFTPGIGSARQAFLNPKFGKIFKLVGPSFGGKGTEAYELQGRDIIEGFKNLGFGTFGSGAMAWFDPQTATGRHLTDSFSRFFYAGPHNLRQQVAWIGEELMNSSSNGCRDNFVFLNVGETHVPYWFDGASWSASDNPCLPFQIEDRSADCRLRQRLCCEFADRELRTLLSAFDKSTILICGDHGDCWGEDGLWEHGISHACTLSVPLVAQIRGTKVEENVGRSSVTKSTDHSPERRQSSRDLFTKIFSRRS